MNDEECFIKCYQDGVLGSRGCTLQERVLSYRMLYYGSSQLYWSCCEATCAADGVQSEPEVLPNIHLPRSLLDTGMTPCQVGSEGYTPHEPNISIYEKWYTLLQSYTGSRRLTKASDKLPALSGIASHIQKLTGDNYAAGLWLGDLCRGFCWQRTSYVPYRRIVRGPSWSWVNFDGSVEFFKDSVVESCIEVIEHTVELKGANPFGEVTGGKLVLRALVQELTLSFRTSLRRTKPDFARSSFDYEDVSEESGIWGRRSVIMWVAKTIDKSPSSFNHQPVNVSMFGIQMSFPPLLPPPKPEEDIIQALILGEVDGRPDVFQRIGQVVVDNIDHTCEEGEEDETIKPQWQILTII